MQQRCFGSSDICSSVIGFGTWPIGGARYGQSDDAEAIAAIHAALEAGITLFDTAPSYGNGHAEELLGYSLLGLRDQATIVTKGGMIWDENAFITGLDSSREHLVKGLDESLARLKTDYVDLFLLHWPDGETPMAEIAESLGHLVQSGKAKADRRLQSESACSFARLPKLPPPHPSSPARSDSASSTAVGPTKPSRSARSSALA